MSAAHTDVAPRDRPPLALIFAITVTGITVNTLIAPSIPDIIRGLGATKGDAGLVVASGTVAGIVLAPVIGILADRFGRREILIPCLLLFAVAGGAGAVVPSLPWLLLARFLQGVGSAGLINLAVVIIGDHWNGPDRARIIGYNSAVLTVCLALFPTLGGALTDLGSWRTPFLLYPAALVTAGLVAVRLPPTPHRDVRFRDQIGEVTPILAEPRIRALMGGSFVMFALIFGALLTVLPVYAEDGFGLDASWRGVLLGIPAVGSTLVALNTGRLTRRMGHRRLLTLAAALVAAALTVIALAPSLPVLVVGTLLFGLAEGATIPSIQDIATSAATVTSRGAVVATQVATARLGQTVGPLTLGPLSDATTAPTAFGVGAAAALAILLPLQVVATRRTTRGR